MIVTVTPNTGLDRVIFVEGFAWGKTMRAHDSAWGMGGKATDVSLVLGRLDEDNLATGFAAGETGHRMVRVLEAHTATKCNFVWVDGETRTNYVLIDTILRSQSTITVSGLQVNRQHVAALERNLASVVSSAACVVVGGSLPPGAPIDLHARLITLARRASVPTILDASGKALRLGVKAGPTVLKPNRDELETLAGRPLYSKEDILSAAARLVQGGIKLVVATMGHRGLWAVSSTEAVFIPPLPVEVVNTAGAGDALVAGISVGIARGWCWQEGLRLGTAAAAAVCMTPGTAVCQRADIEQFLSKVTIIPLQS